MWSDVHTLLHKIGPKLLLWSSPSIPCPPCHTYHSLNQGPGSKVHRASPQNWGHGSSTARMTDQEENEQDQWTGLNVGLACSHRN